MFARPGSNAMRRLNCLPSLALGGLAVLAIAQATPLPAGFLRRLDPVTAALHGDLLPAQPEVVLGDPAAPVAFPPHTISLEPGMTVQAAVRLAAAWVLFQGVLGLTSGFARAASAGAGTRRECDPAGPCRPCSGVDLERQPALDPPFAKRQRLVVRGTIRLPQPFRRVSQPGAGFRPRLPARSGPGWSARVVLGAASPKVFRFVSWIACAAGAGATSGRPTRRACWSWGSSPRNRGGGSWP